MRQADNPIKGSKVARTRHSVAPMRGGSDWRALKAGISLRLAPRASFQRCRFLTPGVKLEGRLAPRQTGSPALLGLVNPA